MRYFIFALFCIFHFFSLAQLTEGKISFEMNMFNENEEAQEATSVIEKTYIDLYFNTNKTRTSVQMGTDMNVTTLVDSDLKKGNILMSGMMGNLCIAATYNEIIDETSAEDLDIEWLETSKDILGYTCKKVKLTDVSGNITTMWYTKEIQFNKAGIENMYDAVPGTPLEFKIESDGTTLIFKAIKLEKGLDKKDKLFSTETPEGYKSITMEQFELGDF